VFDILRIYKSFLNENPELWESNPTFQAGRQRAANLQVVNDVAERGMTLITTFNLIVTKHEEQKQFPLQIVEKHCKDLPQPSKAALTKHYS